MYLSYAIILITFPVVETYMKKETEKSEGKHENTSKEESTIEREILNLFMKRFPFAFLSFLFATAISRMSTRFVWIIKSIYKSWHREILIKATAWPLTVCVRNDCGSYVRRNAGRTSVAHSEFGEAGLLAAALLDRASAVAATCRCQDTSGRLDNTRSNYQDRIDFMKHKMESRVVPEWFRSTAPRGALVWSIILRDVYEFPSAYFFI